ncbi:hypothetical protein BT96DRAFT_988836 [Gymnopus androsaceus JB14]|uniref:Uncharacterized protein n=1 Tax=Gymnopus androsaceus JB14 TaxID=1447944 RepID=A0A6A4I526_9AGAR|nr:hypothetical protein BT96DRAFT_988836 [Gymnopus androsaceus JB14]
MVATWLSYKIKVSEWVKVHRQHLVPLLCYMEYLSEGSGTEGVDLDILTVSACVTLGLVHVSSGTGIQFMEYTQTILMRGIHVPKLDPIFITATAQLSKIDDFCKERCTHWMEKDKDLKAMVSVFAPIQADINKDPMSNSKSSHNPFLKYAILKYAIHLSSQEAHILEEVV